MVKIHTVQRVQNVEHVTSGPHPRLPHPQTSSSSLLRQPMYFLQRSVNTKTRHFMSLVCHFPEFLYLFFFCFYVYNHWKSNCVVWVFLKSSYMILGYYIFTDITHLEYLCILISEGGGHLLKCCTTFSVWLYCSWLEWSEWSCSVVSDFCNPVDCSPPGSSVHRILQARILEWVAVSFSRDLPDPGIEPRSPTLQTDTLTSEPPVVDLTTPLLEDFWDVSSYWSLHIMLSWYVQTL